MTGTCRSNAGEPQPDTQLGKALKLARRLRDFKNDDVAAAKVLDTALRAEHAGPAIQRAITLAARIELALVLDDQPRAHSARAELATLTLTEVEREQHRDELAAAERLERLLHD